MSSETEVLPAERVVEQARSAAPVPSTPVPDREAQAEINTADYQGPDRRIQVPRRERLSFFSLRQISTHRERRTPGRRVEDWDEPYVDWYEPQLMWVVAAVMLLVAMNTFLTLELYHIGEMTISPLMAELLDSDVNLFVALKLAITGLALTLMVIYKNFTIYRIFRVGQMIYLVLAIYLVSVLSSFYIWATL